MSEAPIRSNRNGGLHVSFSHKNMFKIFVLCLLLVSVLVPAFSQSPNISNVAYGTSPQQVLDLYLPNDGQVHPLIVLIHGGAWFSGDKAELAPAAQYLVTKGFAVANINYRLVTATSNQYPTAINDATGAVDFLRANAVSYGYNGSSISALGTSAGAYIALELGIANEVDVVVDFYGPTNLSDTAFLDNTYNGVLNSILVANFLGTSLLDDPTPFTPRRLRLITSHRLPRPRSSSTGQPIPLCRSRSRRC